MTTPTMSWIPVSRADSNEQRANPLRLQLAACEDTHDRRCRELHAATQFCAPPLTARDAARMFKL